MVPAISKPRQIPGPLCTYDVHITSLLYINYHSHFLYVRYAWYMHIHIIVTSATINHKTMIQPTLCTASFHLIELKLRNNTQLLLTVRSVHSSFDTYNYLYSRAQNFEASMIPTIYICT